MISFYVILKHSPRNVKNSNVKVVSITKKGYGFAVKVLQIF